MLRQSKKRKSPTTTISHGFTFPEVLLPIVLSLIICMVFLRPFFKNLPFYYLLGVFIGLVIALFLFGNWFYLNPKNKPPKKKK